MKAIFLAAWNALRFLFLRLQCPGFQSAGLQLLGINTRIVVRSTSRITLGKHIVSDGRITMIVERDGKLTIGDRVYFNENVILSCIEEVRIGDRCLFGPHVCIYDSNHEYDSVSGVKYTSTTAPITIGRGCWIGANVVILKGTTIGDNCVIGAGCVVSGDVPSGSVVTMDRAIVVRKMHG